MKQKITVIIPCYRSSSSLPMVIDSLLNTIKKRTEFDYEIILINDGSPDNGETWNTIKTIANNNTIIKGINLSKNFGQHNAMMAGYKVSKGDIIVGMDDDGENNPQFMFELVDKLSEGYDCVMGEYNNDKKKSIRGLGTKINNKMAEKLINKPKDITLTSFYACKRFIVEQICEYNNAYPYIAGLILQSTNNLGKVSLKREKRISGKSNYSLRKLIRLWVSGFTAFSIKPLRISSTIGFVCATIGFVLGIVIIIRKFFLDVMIGWSSLVSITLFIGGLIMMMLGMIGEYIGRIYLSVNKAPQFVIKEKINIDEE